MDINEYLDAAKRKLGIESDYAFAKHFNFRPSRISNWRSGRNLPDIVMCMHIADTLKIEMVDMLADIELGKELDPDKRKFLLEMVDYERLNRRMAKLRDAAAYAFFALGTALLLATFAPVGSDAEFILAAIRSSSGACVLC